MSWVLLSHSCNIGQSDFRGLSRSRLNHKTLQISHKQQSMVSKLCSELPKNSSHFINSGYILANIALISLFVCAQWDPDHSPGKCLRGIRHYRTESSHLALHSKVFGIVDEVVHRRAANGFCSPSLMRIEEEDTITRYDRGRVRPVINLSELVAVDHFTLEWAPTELKPRPNLPVVAPSSNLYESPILLRLSKSFSANSALLKASSAGPWYRPKCGLSK